MSDEIAISVDHVSKEFKLPHEKQSSIKGALINFAKSGRRKRSFERQQVLKDVSFEIKRGEFFGIVGRNGSGKSTLLKMLAGIYTPTEGAIRVNGKLTPFIELGVGFNHELTGRENVFLNGALLGFNRVEMSAMYDEIVEFAELKKFMDQKLKNYSSGMQVRLAFSIAIKADSDILLLDEVLAVGDEAFQRKCFQYFDELKRNKKTVILVTHSMDSVRQYCDKALMINDGEVVAIGSPDDIANQYSMENLDTQLIEKGQNGGKYPAGRNSVVPKLNIKLLSKTVISNDQKLEFLIEFDTTKDIDVYAGFSISNNGISMLERNSSRAQKITKKGAHSLRYSMPLSQFSDSELKISCGLFDRKTKNEIAYTTDSDGSKYIKVIGGVRPDFMGGLLADKSGEWQ